MKKRYYLSMLSLYPLILAFDCVYFVSHQTLEMFLTMALAHFVLFGLLNFPGTYFLYKPIDHLFIQSGDTKQAEKRINHLTWYSTAWIFSIGILFVVILLSSLFLFQMEIEVASLDKMPPIFFLQVIPSGLFVFAILPSLFTYFLINDFNLDLKAKTFSCFQIHYPVGKKRVGLTLLIVFFILGFFPTLLVILDLVTLSTVTGDEYAQFMSISHINTQLIDQFIVLIGFIFAVVLITRSFTKPIYSLLKEINKVREGDYSTRAAIITEDEIGVLTKNFNEMVHELEISHNKLEESNRTLEIKVEDRTQELRQKNSELEDTLNKLKQMQKQVIVQEKMATLGQLVAGLTHEINTPIGAIRSMNDTKSKAVMKLQTALENIAPDIAGKDHEIRKVMGVILKADKLIDQGTERLNEIIKNLKNFARLDEAETVMADIHEGLDSVLALIRHDLLTNIEVVREYSEIPPFVCHARKLNQVF